MGALAQGPLALGTPLVGCSAGPFVCHDPQDCGAGGTCEPSGYCSFEDLTCPSEQRYGEHAGNDLAGMCVEPIPSGTGTTTGPPTASATSTSSSGPISLDSGPDDSTGSSGSPADTTSSTGPGESSSGSSSTGPGLQRVSDGLLVLYRFDEGAGTIAHDSSGMGSPLDLTLEGEGFQWVADGLVFDGGIARATSTPTKIIGTCLITNEFSAEAWITTVQPDMVGPSRIVTLSESSSLRNFTLGQGGYKDPAPHFMGRTRTSDMDVSDNGTPQLTVVDIATASLTHLVYIRSDEGVHQLWVDGMLGLEEPRPGDFTGWSLTAEFACGNEITLDRPWRGTLHLAAVYDHALSEADIAQNLTVGP